MKRESEVEQNVLEKIKRKDESTEVGELGRFSCLRNLLHSNTLLTYLLILRSFKKPSVLRLAPSSVFLSSAPRQFQYVSAEFFHLTQF